MVDPSGTLVEALTDTPRHPETQTKPSWERRDEVVLSSTNHNAVGKCQGGQETRETQKEKGRDGFGCLRLVMGRLEIMCEPKESLLNYFSLELRGRAKKGR